MWRHPIAIGVEPITAGSDGICSSLTVGDTGSFAIGERVLVPFTDDNYEATIMKAEHRLSPCMPLSGTCFSSMHCPHVSSALKSSYSSYQG